MKNDTTAIELYGQAYSKIPKSVFALLAWHIANMASGEADSPGAAQILLAEESIRLYEAGIITEKQARDAVKALRG